MPDILDNDKIQQNAEIQPVSISLTADALNAAYLSLARTNKDSFKIQLDDREIRNAKEMARYGQPLRYFVYAENAVLLDGRIRGILYDEYQKVARYKRLVRLPDWASDNSEAKKAKAFVERLLERVNFYDVFLHLCSMHLYGFAFQEIVFETCLDDSFKDIFSYAPVVPKQINQLLHKYCYAKTDGKFYFMQDDNSDVLLSDRLRFHLAFHPLAKPHLLSRPFPFDKSGIYPALFEAWYEKHKTMIDYDIFRERYAEPTLSMSYEDANTEKAAQDIQRAYDRAGRLRSLVRPKGLDTQFLESANLSSADQVFNSPISREDETINILFRGNNLDTESDTNKASSVTGLTKEQERHKAMCDIVDEAFMGIIEKVLRFNFTGSLHVMPIVYTPFVPAKDMSQIRENIRLATELGVALKAEIFEELNIPVADDQKDVLLRPPAAFAPDGDLGVDSDED